MLIKTIDQLREYVRINRSKDFDTYKPYINDAQNKFILPYFGKSIIDKLKTNNGDALYPLVCAALGPFSLAMATPEIALNFGESGLTVTRTDTLAPASEAKIERAVQSLMERGFANLDIAIKYVEEHASVYPEWLETVFADLLKSKLFSSARNFQDAGNINIDNSPLVFFNLLPLIKRVEGIETMLLLPANFKDTYADITDIPDSLMSLLQAYTASRVGAIVTSKETRVQRGKPRTLTEFSAFTAPLFENMDGDENFYQNQAEAYKIAIHNELIRLEVISTDATVLKWNDEDKKTFIANAR